MRHLLDFDDAGASDDHPAKGVTVGDIRAWYDDRERLRNVLRWYANSTPGDYANDNGFNAEAALMDVWPQHASDCAVHNAPALSVGPCDCGATSRT